MKDIIVFLLLGTACLMFFSIPIITILAIWNIITLQVFFKMLFTLIILMAMFGITGIIIEEC